MSQPVAIPYRSGDFKASQLQDVLALNRATVQGWVARYDLSAIGIEPVKSGSTRRFTMEQIGVFAVLRVVAAIQQIENALEALPEIAAHAEATYASACAGIRWESWGQDVADRRPYLPAPETPYHLEGRVGMFGNATSFHVTDRPYSAAGTMVRDLKRFPLPTVLVPLDETLRTAWTRATFAAYGFNPAD